MRSGCQGFSFLTEHRANAGWSDISSLVESLIVWPLLDLEIVYYLLLWPKNKMSSLMADVISGNPDVLNLQMNTKWQKPTVMLMSLWLPDTCSIATLTLQLAAHSSIIKLFSLSIPFKPVHLATQSHHKQPVLPLCLTRTSPFYIQYVSSSCTH